MNGTAATITPVRPPSTKTTMNASANSNGGLKDGRPLQIVAIQAKTWMPLGMAIAHAGAAEERQRQHRQPDA